ncbi:MAG: hypothetical protein K2K22_03495, partial [Muribaculaceae bacterium]|nr:hypothetical protein [Muribaculaceae bacterium]
MAAFLPTADARGETSLKLPDFAYPKTVEADATKALEQADAATGDSGPIRLRALLELCAAQRTIDANSSFSQPALIAQQLAKPGLSNASKAMLLSLEANILGNIYSRQSYKYNRVTAPLEPYPADISEWSGEQFRTRVMALLDSAALLADATPLSVFAASIEYSPEALTYLPTVSDFIRYRRAQTCQDFSRYNYSDYSALQKQICDEGIKASKVASAPFFYWSVKRALLISDTRQSYDKINELYSAYDSVEAARYALAALCDRVSMPSYNDEHDESYEFRLNEAFAKELKTSLSTFPKWYDNAVLSNKLADITRSRASAEAADMVAPAIPFDIKIRYQYAKTVKVALYKVSANTNVNPTKLAGSTPAAQAEVTPDNSCGVTTSQLCINNPGIYAMLVSVDGKTSASYMQTIHVTPLLGITINGCKQGAALALDFSTGAPLKGVDVIGIQNYPKKSSKAFGKTDSKGIASYNATDIEGYYDMTLRYNGASYSFRNSLAFNGYHSVNDSTERNSIIILTDRNLYHPGQDIQWAIVAGAKTGRSIYGKAVADKEIVVKLFDTNGEQVDSCKATTDELGRAFGTFTTNKNVLTGSYSIMASYRRGVAFSYVTVSDFKAPVFEVLVDSVKRDTPVRGAVSIQGTARTYSGMPVADASVKIDVRGTYRWRWFAPSVDLGTIDASTDSDGRFSAVIPVSVLSRELDNGTAFTDFIATVD